MLSSQRLCPSLCSLSVARIWILPCSKAKQWACRWRLPAPVLSCRHGGDAMAEVEIFSDKSALIRAEAERIVTLANEAISARGRCLISLSGGSTPRPLYELLASAPYASRIDWPRMHLFWGDERCVPPDHVDSNYR